MELVDTPNNAVFCFFKKEGTPRITSIGKFAGASNPLDTAAPLQDQSSEEPRAYFESHR